jgi:hypothetical protein
LICCLGLPSQISNLTHLQTLNLTNNHLEELPSSIISLAHLRILKLGHNYLCSLPRSFGSLKSLEILDLTGNDLNEENITKDFFQLSKSINLISYSHRDYFFFEGNLRALYLGDNLFETFPNEHLDKLQSLQIVSRRDFFKKKTQNSSSCDDSTDAKDEFCNHERIFGQ